jgi:hypothetical protein
MLAGHKRRLLLTIANPSVQGNNLNIIAVSGDDYLTGKNKSGRLVGLSLLRIAMVGLRFPSLVYACDYKGRIADIHSGHPVWQHLRSCSFAWLF